MDDRDADFPEILDLLRENDSSVLWQRADATRRRVVGDEVHLRGLIEISNTCVRNCSYCGLRAANTAVKRYRLSADEILACTHLARDSGCGTVVLQGGEDYGLATPWVESLIRRIKDDTQLAVTLSLGERPDRDLAAWRRAGADRYLLRFETSDRALYRRIHPLFRSRPSDRVQILRRLKALGYETGGGVMVGIPGQTYESLARDILLFRELDLDMIGVGPFLAHPQVPMGKPGWRSEVVVTGDQVPNSELMVCKVIALSRLLCPEANIPSTTALETLNPSKGHEMGLLRGANVIMPNLTPAEYRVFYDIYPKKDRQAPCTIGEIKARIAFIGRTIGKGPGGRIARAQEDASLYKNGE